MFLLSPQVLGIGVCVTVPGVSFTFKFVLVDFHFISFLVFLILLFGREKKCILQAKPFLQCKKLKFKERQNSAQTMISINFFFNRDQFVDVH